MTQTNFFDDLENCLQALDQGEDVESCLARFPAQAQDLRPILAAAIQARSIAVTEVPEAARTRGKARVLQAAAEMRAQGKAVPASTIRQPSQRARWIRLAATTAVMLVFLLTGGTGLVNASGSAIPGDNLYSVKRSWEDVQLFFVLDSTTKVQLEHEFDHERVQEIEELYSEKRIAQVNFHGSVQAQKDGIWVIDGLNIAVDDETNLDANILPGATVQVIGETDDGMIKAERISLIATPGDAPIFAPSSTLAAPSQPEASDTLEPNEPTGDKTESEKNAAETKPALQPGESEEEGGGD